MVALELIDPGRAFFFSIGYMTMHCGRTMVTDTSDLPFLVTWGLDLNFVAHLRSQPTA